MIIVEIGKGESLDSALKKWKNKVVKSGLINELRERQQYTKKSIKRRSEVLKAKWKQNLQKED